MLQAGDADRQLLGQVLVGLVVVDPPELAQGRPPQQAPGHLGRGIGDQHRVAGADRGLAAIAGQHGRSQLARDDRPIEHGGQHLLVRQRAIEEDIGAAGGPHRDQAGVGRLQRIVEHDRRAPFPLACTSRPISRPCPERATLAMPIPPASPICYPRRTGETARAGAGGWNGGDGRRIEWTVYRPGVGRVR
ncbi:MAG: hypothetical protein R3D25_21710 [Geminicoccaceae bacterium]